MVYNVWGSQNAPVERSALLSHILAIDVGAGTQDILLHDSDKTVENCVKLVLPSRTVTVAGRIARATQAGQTVFLTGNLMGGGPLASAAKKHARAGLPICATPLAAKSIRDDLSEVEALGITIVDSPPVGAVTIDTKDVDLDAIGQALALFDVPLPERYAIAVQDHGESSSLSQRRFRFKQWADFVKAGGRLRDLAYVGKLPRYLTRMQAVLSDVPNALLMDTCSAAVVGALCDEHVAGHSDEGLVIVNVGNQHTLGVLCKGDRIWGVFEHHTVFMDTEKLKQLIERLQAGSIDNDEIYEDKGHGAYVHPGYFELNTSSASPFEFVAVTGPNRHIARGLGYHFATPYGDMMLSGCFGLIRAACWFGWTD